MVGDVKQSIYRFRQAMPEIFIHKRSAYHDYDGQNYPARIVLSNNFRSRSQVTDAINYLFYALMSREVGEIDYDDSEALTPSAVYPEHLQADTEMHLVENRSEELSGQRPRSDATGAPGRNLYPAALDEKSRTDL